MDVRRIDHVYIAVRDLGVSERFYDPVMEALGFRKGTRAIGGEPHLHYFNRAMQYTLRPARSGSAADPYRVGSLHHLCFQLDDAAAVDEAHRRLRQLGVAASEPRLYPEYRPDYYATFFEDPDGIRLELVCDTAGRRLVRERWDELVGFTDPVARLLERDAQGPEAVHAADRLPGQDAATSVPLNLFVARGPDTGETFERLADFGDVFIERIVSSKEPGTELYEQTQDEWVALLRGAAELEVAGQLLRLSPGDSLLLPAGTPHRVHSTEADTLWIAVHVGRRGEGGG